MPKRYLVSLIAALALALPASAATVSTSGTNWQIDGQTVQLWGVRTVNAIYSDATVDALVAQLDNWYAHGIKAVSIGMQGGRTGNSPFQTEGYNCFASDGTFSSTCKTRLVELIEALDSRGMVAMLTLFYQAGDDSITVDNTNNTHLFNAIDEVAGWVESQGYTNILVDICNEHGHSGFSSHTILQRGADDATGQSRMEALCDRWALTSTAPCSVSPDPGPYSQEWFTYDYQVWHAMDDSGRDATITVSGTVPAVINEMDRLDDYDEPGEFTDAEATSVANAIARADTVGYGFFFHAAWIQGVYEDGTVQGPRFDLGNATVTGAQSDDADANRSIDWAFDLIAAEESLAPDADFYVRTDGDDSNCNGDHDAPYVAGRGSAQACAYKKVSVGEAAAGCGDTVYIGSGEFFETAKINLNTAGCGSGTKKRVKGAGQANTRIYFGLIGPLENCAAAGTYTYTCDVPSGGMVDSATNGQNVCFVQKLGSSTIDWDFKGNGVKASEYVSTCLTPTSATTGAIDYDDDGAGDSNLDSTNGRGFWYAGAGATSYTINPAGGLAPSSTVQFYAPITSPPSISFELDGAYNVVEDLTIFTAGNGLISFTANGDNAELNRVDAYHAYLGVGTSNSLVNAQINDVRIMNTIRRIRNKGCGYNGNPCDDTGDFVPGASTPGCKIYGDGTDVDGLECYMGNEGLSFAGQNHTIRNVKSHGWMNHGCKFNEVYTDATFDNLICYNNQEGAHFAGCQQDLLFRHATIHGTVIYNGELGTDCADGSNAWTNVDWRNSIIEKISHNGDAYGTDPRAADGAYGHRDLDYDYNAWFNATAFITHSRGPFGGDCSFSSIANWNNYTCGAEASDSCTNCERDTNSVLSTAAALFVNATNQDLASDPPDYRLATGSPAINLGSATYTSTTDYNGETRDGSPDAGAFEYTGAVTYQCNDGLDNDSDGLTDYGSDDGCSSLTDNDERLCGDDFKDTNETCDCAATPCTSQQLNSHTCVTQGYDQGDLGCNVSCAAFDTSGCSNLSEPGAGKTVKRTGRVGGGTVR